MADFTKQDIEMISALETLFGKHKFSIRDELGQLKSIGELIGFAAKHFSSMHRQWLWLRHHQPGFLKKKNNKGKLCNCKHQ